ncbi:MAG: nicotinamide-nucleotide amidohydrolase family protein [Puniceicoccales bacterium]|jgi:PncC family amidohydrolase|nr:nicotinamide-nucleotide amidohydrolase family protein [Puniceicoccales bacterium]
MEQHPPVIFTTLYPYAREVVDALAEGGKTLAVAESCTGGLLGAVVTSVPGASMVFVGGLITYSIEAKLCLGVPREVMDRYGVVSAECAAEMARAAAVFMGADVGVGITGVAGPGGATREEPRGAVYIGLFSRWTGASAVRFLFEGDRAAVRTQAVGAALSRIRSVGVHSGG